MAWQTWNLTTVNANIGFDSGSYINGNEANNWVINGNSSANSTHAFNIYANGQTAYGAYVFGSGACETIYSNIAGATLSGGLGEDKLFSTGTAANAWFVWDGKDIIDGNIAIDGSSTWTGLTSAQKMTADASTYGAALYMDMNTYKNASGTAVAAVYDVNKFIGTAYADYIAANQSYNITLDGGLGADTLVGGAAGTTIVFDALDTVKFSSTAAYHADGYQKNILDASAQTSNLQVWMSADDSKFTRVGKFVAGSGADNIRGDAYNNYIDGGAGDDLLWGGDGTASKDTLYGGKGNDTYFVGEFESDDLIVNDVGNMASDVVNFYNIAATDILGTDGANIKLDGTADIKFTLAGLGTTLKLEGAAGTGTDRVKDFISKEGWHFSVTVGKTGDDTLTGSASTIDNIYAATAGSYIDGKGGRDNLFGGDSNDTFVYNAGDVIRGGGGTANTLTAVKSTSGVQIYMESMDVKKIQVLNGSNYDDELRGNKNEDGTVDGKDGNDAIWGGAGVYNDTLIGGKGADTYYYGVGEGNDTINAGTTTTAGNALDTLNFYTDGLTTADVKTAVVGDSLVITVKNDSRNTITLNSWTTANDKLNNFVIGGKNYTTDGTTWTAK